MIIIVLLNEKSKEIISKSVGSVDYEALTYRGKFYTYEYRRKTKNGVYAYYKENIEIRGLNTGKF